MFMANNGANVLSTRPQVVHNAIGSCGESVVLVGSELHTLGTNWAGCIKDGI